MLTDRKHRTRRNLDVQPVTPGGGKSGGKNATWKRGEFPLGKDGRQLENSPLFSVDEKVVPVRRASAMRSGPPDLEGLIRGSRRRLGGRPLLRDEQSARCESSLCISSFRMTVRYTPIHHVVVDGASNPEWNTAATPISRRPSHLGAHAHRRYDDFESVLAYSVVEV